MTTKNPCSRDTNGDGDCHRCHREGCPFLVFCPAMIDRAVMSDDEIRKFRGNAERFEYTEPWLGTIRGYRNKEGRVLIESHQPE